MPHINRWIRQDPLGRSFFFLRSRGTPLPWCSRWRARGNGTCRTRPCGDLPAPSAWRSVNAWRTPGCAQRSPLLICLVFTLLRWTWGLDKRCHIARSIAPNTPISPCVHLTPTRHPPQYCFMETIVKHAWIDLYLMLRSERSSSSYLLRNKNLDSLDCVRLQLDPHNASRACGHNALRRERREFIWDLALKVCSRPLWLMLPKLSEMHSLTELTDCSCSTYYVAAVVTYGHVLPRGDSIFCFLQEEDNTKEEEEMFLLTDVALGLSLLMYQFLEVLYRGPSNTSEEDDCQHLLTSRLLQRSAANRGSIPHPPASLHPLPPPPPSSPVPHLLSFRPLLPLPWNIVFIEKRFTEATDLAAIVVVMGLQPLLVRHSW